jgi:2-hydroxychromene-2-carboxylate isomerase
MGDGQAARTIEFWFEYGSTYTYLSVMRIEALAAPHKIEIVWCPFLLMPIMIEAGMKDGPFLSHPSKLRYMWRDVERRARRYNLAYDRPLVYPPNTLLTARIGLLASREGWCAPFTQTTFRLHWTEGKTIGTAANLNECLGSLRKDLDATLRAAESDEIKAALRTQVERAKTLGIFGSPSFIADGDLFWGDDRLEDAIDACLVATSAGLPRNPSD